MGRAAAYDGLTTLGRTLEEALLLLMKKSLLYSYMAFLEIGIHFLLDLVFLLPFYPFLESSSIFQRFDVSISSLEVCFS